ncbi:MAG: bifunctional folylpolyglutamate synthase/dihydrofolate synthase [Geobacter sp.]|nr:bifunctional folylpolyglutamate synthase/dihydrofolate synthase [Geobacter sp.]
MTYEETLAHIFSRGRFGMKPGLERITLLLELLGNPHHGVRAVQIAGTNGKGSTGAFLSAIMTAAGYRTAYFSSPHLLNFTERFRINDADLPESTVHRAAGKVLTVAPPEATFFELVTAIAFVCFAEEKVDVAIIEAGMGGAHDATNVATGLLSVITPISLDHCDYLGDTIARIAAEKAGIIKQGRPVVVAGQAGEALQVIKEMAQLRSARLILADADFRIEAQGENVVFTGFDRVISCQPALQGAFQAENLALAIAAALQLAKAGFTVSDADIARGAAAARWPGRMELFPGVPPLLLDGAHNPAGARALQQSLAAYQYQRLILVIGVMADKAWQEVLLTLLPLASLTVAVTPSLERALPAGELAAFCLEQGYAAVAAGTPAQGVELARAEAQAGDLVLVAGSLFTVGEVRGYLTDSSFMPIRG